MRYFEILIEAKHLSESFNNALPFKWTHKSERQWLAYFKAGKNRYKILIARRKNPNVGSSWELEFVQVSTSFFGSETVRSDITGTGLAFSILSTIIASAREFLKEVRPDILYFSSKEESRTKLYSALFSRLKKSLADYNFSTIAHPVEDGSLLFIIKQKNGLEESARIDETVVGYHGSRAGDPVFKIGHSGNNAHTFGAYDSHRYGAFFSDNPKFASLYGNVKQYVLNIHDTADLNTPYIRQEFMESLDPFDPVERPFWLAVHHSTKQTWQLFEDKLGERFTKFLLDNGYDSATFTEYNEDAEGNEFKSNTIVVLKPELIRETKLTEGQAKDAADEEDRVFTAYLKKNRIDLTSLGRMSYAEREKLRTDALANRNKYPVPVSEPEFLYHGTSKARLPLIAQRGLLPSEKSRWSKDVGIGDWSIGKVFFTDTIRSASFYAREASKSQPIILRVKTSNLTDTIPDPKDKGGFYIERTVPPNQIEVWTGKSWKPIA